MSTAKRETIAPPPELFQGQDNSQASRQPFKIDPDIATACAFATIAVLLAVYVAFTFPQWSEVWPW
jgi:hypothetical protein